MSVVCCPPNSAKYLAADYATTGSVVTFGDNYEAYVSGSLQGGNVVLIIPDIWGWNGGRTRSMADQLAEAGYCAVVPKLLLPCYEGGTDGDGLPPDFDIEIRGAEAWPWLKTITWNGSLRPIIAACLDFIKSYSPASISSVGICWGGWVLVRVFDEFGDDFRCGVIPHPSITVEGLHGGDPVAVSGRVKKPILIMPAKNDGDTYRPGGDIFEALRGAAPLSETTDRQFDDVVHGWVPRGELSDPVVKRQVEAAVEKMFAYIARFV